jgi:hypothetical protein
MSMPAQPMPAPQPGPARPTNGIAIVGFILAILGFLGSFIPVINIGGIVLGIAGAILAVVGLSKSKQLGVGRGLSLAGIIIGGLALLIGVGVNIAAATLFSSSVDDASQALDDLTDVTIDTDDMVQPADGGAGASRDNPVPIGTALSSDDWTVTIDSVTTATSDALGQTPADGSTLLVVTMTATYEGSDDQGSMPWASIRYVTADGSSISSFDGSAFFATDTPFDGYSTVYQGGSVTGDEVIEVPADAWQDGVLAVSPSAFADDVFVAVE